MSATTTGAGAHGSARPTSNSSIVDRVRADAGYQAFLLLQAIVKVSLGALTFETVEIQVRIRTQHKRASAKAIKCLIHSYVLIRPGWIGTAKRLPIKLRLMTTCLGVALEKNGRLFACNCLHPSHINSVESMVLHRYGANQCILLI